jgi:hypothetical protein
MEQLCGRPLKLREVVHHRNEDKRDNDRSNLLLFASQADHLAFHRLERGAPLVYLAPVETGHEPRRRRVFFPRAA